ncbi:MAG TPA: ricin-type beta-trefoil lectin domain protein [Pseudonocardiaceae bacterium]|jgi:glucosylceramidase|nr:ricin-type beta-trefoil lectin domain protein [Pseudonocardiaceae bacterium]
MRAFFRLSKPIRWLVALSALALVAGAATATAAVAPQAGSPVNIWLTSTSDSTGRTVTRGLQQQTASSFATGTASGGNTIDVNDNQTYQQFTGAGASFTDSAAWLMNSSGALSASTRSAVMTKLFDPTNGIGLSFLRNPMGASDLARTAYTYDDQPAGTTDPTLAHFSIAHDLADVVPLTKQALALNPALKVMATPWSAPAWMKDDDQLTQPGWLQSQYYAAYAQYFVKYIQAYQAQGIPISFVSAQNEPTCCSGYPSMSWNGAGLDYFTANDLLPAFHAAGISTKTLALDWNWDSYASYGAPEATDPTVENDSDFGGIAWHGYEGDVSEQTTVHDQNPAVDAYDTEHAGGTWIANQQQQDMLDIIDYTRNWGKTVTKWTLAVDQTMGPHDGGCSTCTGLITVHNGDARSGQVDYNIEYYDMGQLTKFVKPGAYRVASTANGNVPNVAFHNPDGSTALVAYNNTSSAQTVKVNWGNQTFSYSLPTMTSATFTWTGSQSADTTATGRITGLGGQCTDVAAGNATDGTAVDLYTCNGTEAQSWTVEPDGSVQAMGKCLDVTSGSTANGAAVDLYSCNESGAQVWKRSGSELINTQANKCLDATNNSSANGTKLQIWSCTGTANQLWNVGA